MSNPKNFLDEIAEGIGNAVNDLLSGKVFEGPEDLPKTKPRVEESNDGSSSEGDEPKQQRDKQRARETIFKRVSKPKPKPPESDSSSDSEEEGEAPGKQESTEGTK